MPANLFRAAGATTGLTIVNVIVGFACQAVIARELGLGSTSDRYQLAYSAVTFGAVTLSGLAMTLLVPQMAARPGRDWGAVLRWMPTVGLMCMLLQLAGAWALQGYDRALAVMLLFSAPCHLLAGLASSGSALALVRRRFALAASSPVLNGAFLLVFLVATLPGGWNAVELGTSLSVGYLGQFVVFAPSLVRALEARPSERTLRSVAAGPVLGLIVFSFLSKLQAPVERLITVGLEPGSAAALGFGQKMAQAMLLFAAFSLSIVALPAMSDAHASGDSRRKLRLLSKTVVTTILAASAVVAFALPLLRITIELLFAGGSFAGEQVAAVTAVALAQVPWVLACALTGPFTSYLYASHRYREVVFAAIAGMGMTAMLGLVLRATSPDLAAPLASSAGTVTTFFVVLWRVLAQDSQELVRGLAASRDVMMGASLFICAGLTGLALAWPADEWGSAALGAAFPSAVLVLMVANPRRRQSVRGLLREAV